MVFSFYVVFESRDFEGFYFWIPYVSKEKFRIIYNSEKSPARIVYEGRSKEKAVGLYEKLNSGSKI